MKSLLSSYSVNYTHFWMICLSITLLNDQTLISSLKAQTPPSTLSIPATVDGSPVNARIFNDHSALLLRRSRKEPTLKYRNHVARRVLKPLIYNIILRKELKKKGLKINQNEIDQQFKDLKSSYSKKTSFEEYLIRIGHTTDSKMIQLWNRKATYLLMEKQGLLKVTPAQMKANYQHLKSRYIRPEQVRARQILIYLPKNPTPKQVKDAFDQAQKLHADLIKTPQNFDLFPQ